LQLTDAQRRALRTALQSLIATLISTGVLSSVGTSGVVDWSVIHKTVVSIFAAVITAGLAFGQNLLENRTAFPELPVKK
jgi:hypothetical protein